MCGLSYDFDIYVRFPSSPSCLPEEGLPAASSASGSEVSGRKVNKEVLDSLYWNNAWCSTDNVVLLKYLICTILMIFALNVQLFGDFTIGIL